MIELFHFGPDRQRGFTLLELMIVVVVIAILAALAIPNYGRYAFRARRDDGQELLLRIAQAQERYFTSYNKYAASLADIGFAGSPVVSEHQYYQATVATSNADAEFTATAKPVGAQAGDKCGNLTLSSTGVKTPLVSNTAANSNGKCW